MKTFEIHTDYIELIKLLKVLHVAVTGGHAKLMVENGEVLRNSQPETRKRAKIRRGDVIEVNGEKIKIE